MIIMIKAEDIHKSNGINKESFPKYTSQLINWANQNAQGTRARVVGQLSDLFPEYQKQSTSVSLEDWKEWYLNQYPDAIEHASDKIFKQVENLAEAMKLIDRELVQKWVEDLVITKTFNGMYIQKAILSKIAENKGLDYRLATPDEESIGIDGYVGDKAYSIKPDTYKLMSRLSEVINVSIVYYSKTKSGLRVEIDG